MIQDTCKLFRKKNIFRSIGTKVSGKTVDNNNTPVARYTSSQFVCVFDPVCASDQLLHVSYMIRH